MKIILESKSVNETFKIASFITKFLFKGSVITLNGDLGAGKTTFTKGVGKALKIDEEINSPTFNILKCYFNDCLNLYHIDAYRLEDVPEENKNIGLEEIIEGDGITLIEWPIFIKNFINFSLSLNITINLINNDYRLITLETANSQYRKLFEEIRNEDFIIR